MKLLLLLFILSPVILFGQTRRQAIVDSIKAEGTNLRHVSELVNDRGTMVEGIQVSDSGEYITMVVRVHISEPMTEVPILPIACINMGDAVSGVMESVVVPSLPIVLDAEMIPVRPLLVFSTGDIHPFKIDTVALLPLSYADIEPAAIPIFAVAQYKVEVIVISKVDTASAPPLSYADIEPAALLIQAVAQYKVEDIAFKKADTVHIPVFPDIELETIEDLPLCTLVIIALEKHSADRMDTVAVPEFIPKKIPVEGMHLSADGYSLLQKLEGFSPNLYSLMDGGFTIGFGFFVPNAEVGTWAKGVTWEDAERMIREKVPAYEDQVKQYINVPLTQNEFDALTMLAYNLGGFSKATSIVNDINRFDDFDKLQADWKRFVHSKAPGVSRGLMNRRKDELGVRSEANYQPERKIQILKK